MDGIVFSIESGPDLRELSHHHLWMNCKRKKESVRFQEFHALLLILMTKMRIE